MEWSRRGFIRKSVAGTAAAMISPGLLAGKRNNDQDFQNGDLLFGFSTENTILDDARRNIKRIRQRDAEILLLDKNGSPLVKKEVNVEQLTHQFLFGDNNWNMSAMVRNGMANTDRLKYYRKRFSEVLNALNTTVYWTERPRNDAAKTEDFQGELRMDDFDESVNWALSQELTAKGHPMYWTVPKAIPEWLSRYPEETHMKFVEVRIRNLAARYKNRVKIWDAVNEMLWEPHPRNLAKRVWPYTETMENMTDYIKKVISWAREEDPNALFTINDYGLSRTTTQNLADQHGNPVTAQSQRKRYIELINRLGDAGASPNLMGLQCHTGWLTPAEQMAFYDEMSTAGIPLTITEFWANTGELKKMAEEPPESEEWRTFGNQPLSKKLSETELKEIRDQYILDYLTCAFGHPNVDSFYFWGFISMAVSFKNEYDSSHEIQPIFEKVKELIHNQWKTKLRLKTDNKGIIRFRGFCGGYSLKIKPENGPETGYLFSIDKNQANQVTTIKTILS